MYVYIYIYIYIYMPANRLAKEFSAYSPLASPHVWPCGTSRELTVCVCVCVCACMCVRVCAL